MRRVLDQRRFAQRYLFPVILVLLTVVVYGQVGSFQFLVNWDDAVYVTGNDMIRELSPATVKAMFSTTVEGNYAPLHILSYAIDHLFWGLNPAGYHLTNLVLHGANGILCYLLLSTLGWEPVAALIAAALFLVHPVQVESVAWVSQRKNLLAMTLFILSLLAYSDWRLRRRNSYLSYGLSLGFFGLSLLTKTVTVFLPGLLLLFEFCRVAPGERRYRAVIPHMVLAAAAAWGALQTHSMALGGGRTSWHGGNLLSHAMTMCAVVGEYFRNLVVPNRLSNIYVPPVKTSPDFAVLFPVAVLLILGILLARWFRRDRMVLFWGGLAILAMLPTINIVPIVTMMNDRYLYFPMLGIAPLVVAAGISLEHRVGIAPATVRSLLALLIVVLAGMSWQRATVWQDSVSLWSDAAKKFPAAAEPLIGLGEALAKAGDRETALGTYRRALALGPDNQQLLNNMAVLLMEKGDHAGAQTALLRLIRLNPKDPVAFFNLGNSYFMQGEMARAESAYLRADALEPSSMPLLQLGNIYTNRGDFRRAREFFARADRMASDRPEILYAWGGMEALAGDYPLAIRLLEKAFRLGYGDVSYLRRDPAIERLGTVPAFRAVLKRYFPTEFP